MDVSRTSATLIVYEIPTVKFSHSKLPGIFFRVVTTAAEQPNIKYYEDLVGIGIMDTSAPGPEGVCSVVLCNTFK